MTQEQRHYEEVRNYSKEEVEAALTNGTAKVLSVVVVGVSMHSDDHAFACNLCRKLSADENALVRGNAILGFGHLARRFGEMESSVQQIVESGLKDDDEYVRGQAWAAAEDLEHFLGWDVVGFDG